MLSITIYSNGDETTHTKPWWVSNHSIYHLMSGSLVITKPLNCYMKIVWWELSKTTQPLEVICLTWRINALRPKKSTNLYPHIKIWPPMHLHKKWALMCLHQRVALVRLHQREASTRLYQRCTYALTHNRSTANIK